MSDAEPVANQIYSHAVVIDELEIHLRADVVHLKWPYDADQPHNVAKSVRGWMPTVDRFGSLGASSVEKVAEPDQNLDGWRGIGLASRVADFGASSRLGSTPNSQCPLQADRFRERSTLRGLM